jgi:predicted dithiol-disulfide oxidoreductase (DUF899 family)/membrane protein DedA with SNARE-associated domain
MTAVIERFGVLGIFLLMVPESACVPLPSEVTLLFSGFAVRQGWISLPLAVLAATAGNLAGSLLAYALGASHALERLPGARAVLDRWDVLLERHGTRAVFVARLLPLARTFVSLPAGARRVRLAPFIALTTLGCALWAAGFVVAGMFLGGAWTAVDSILGRALLALGAVALAVSVLRPMNPERRTGLRTDEATTEEATMSLPDIVSREEWTRARVALLEREKALTKARDELSAERRRLPMVEVTENYRFTAEDGGSATLLDMFEGRHQLIVDHYMFDPEWEDGCMSCAGRIDQYGNTAHLHARDTTIAVVARAPIEKLVRWKHKMGWTDPWYSSHGSRFNFDYGVSFDDTVEHPVYNYRSAEEWQARGMPAPSGELHGTSVFLRVGDRVFHTYSTYGRGTEQVGGDHYYLDMTALGRQEDWEEPKGRATALRPRADQPGAGAIEGAELRRHRGR